MELSSTGRAQQVCIGYCESVSEVAYIKECIEKTVLKNGFSKIEAEELYRLADERRAKLIKALSSLEAKIKA